MFQTLVVRASLLLTVLLLPHVAWGAVEVATTGGSAVSVVGVAVPVLVDPGITVTNTSATALDQVTAVIGLGGVSGAGNDTLDLPATAGITSAFDAASLTLGLTATTPGSVSAAQWQAALRTMTFATGSRVAGVRTVSIALGSAKPLASNGHFYAFVPGNILWSAALAAAADPSMRLFGLQGYLATITSRAENDFIRSKITSNAWIGGSSDYHYVKDAHGAAVYATYAQGLGHFHWVTGPEAGQLFSFGIRDQATGLCYDPADVIVSGTSYTFPASPTIPAPVITSGLFANWNGGEPNNAGRKLDTTGEWNVHMFTGSGLWNDLHGTTLVGGYTVEYGGMPGDPSVTLQASRSVAVGFDPPLITTPNPRQNAVRPVISGTTAHLEGNATAANSVKVQVRLDLTNDGTFDVTYAVTANASGAWTVNTASATPQAGAMANLADATVTRVEARTFNAAAATVATSGAVPGGTTLSLFTTDRSAPSAPAIAGPVRTGSLTPTITGTAEPGSTVTVVIGGHTYAGIPTDPVTGAWSLAAPTLLPLATGSVPGQDFPLTVTATDAAGNVGPAASASIHVDNVAPAAPVITGPASPQNSAFPVVSGTAEAGSTVTVVLAGATYQVTADAAGRWAVDTAAATPVSGALPASGLADGSTTPISAVATDAVGNASTSGTGSILTDLTPPARPVVSAPGGIIGTGSPTLQGTAPAGGSVIVTVDPDGDPSTANNVVYTTTADGSGLWSVATASATPTTGTWTALADGAVMTTTAVAIDLAGNRSPASVPRSATIDRQAPLAPTITGPASPTNAGSPVVQGGAEPGSTVVVTIDPDNDPATANSMAYTVVADATGRWSIPTATAIPTTGTWPAGGIADGATAGISAVATDAAGNASVPGAATVTEDRSVPAAPVITGPRGVTNQAFPTLTGSAEAGSTVTVVLDPDHDPATADGITYTLVVPSSGQWSIATAVITPVSGSFPANGLPSGAVAGLAITARDVANNLSATTTGTFAVDTTAPGAPTISGPHSPTNQAAPVITGGNAEPGALVTVTIDPDRNPATANGVTYQVVADAGGAWSVDTATLAPATGTFPVGGLADGALVGLIATQTDSAGNTGAAATQSVIVDRSAPPAPTLTAPLSPINQGAPLLGGVAEPGSRVSVAIDRDGNPATADTVVYATVADASGRWTIPTATATPVAGIALSGAPLLDGALPTLTVAATDAAGNTGAATVVTLPVDLSLPAAPLITGPLVRTNDRSPVITGIAEPGAIVTLTVQGIDPVASAPITLGFTTTADPVTGHWSVNTETATVVSGPGLPAGGFADATSLSISALATDAAGNAGPSSATDVVLIDASAPAAPVITGPASPTNRALPVVTGTAEPGNRVHVALTVSGQVITYEVIADAAGVWLLPTASAAPTGGGPFPPAGVPSETALGVAATQTDAAGNGSPAAQAQIAVDTIAPAAPVMTGPSTPTNDTTPTISGTAEPGTTLTVVLTATGSTGVTVVLTYATPVDGAGHWAIDTGTAVPLSGTMPVGGLDKNVAVLLADATDAAGNTGPGTALSIVIDSVPPEPPTLARPTGSTASLTPLLGGSVDAKEDIATFTVTIDPNGDGDLGDAVIFTHAGTIPAGTGAWSLDLAAQDAGGQIAGWTSSATAPFAFGDGARPVIRLVSIDSAANATSGSGSFIVDATAPAVPAFTGPASPTADTTPVITGTAEAGAVVVVTVTQGATVQTYTTTAGANGRWSVDTGSGTALAEGTAGVSAVAYDLAGNASTAAAETLTIDATGPAAPVIRFPVSSTGISLPDIGGTVEPGATVTVVLDPDNDPATTNSVTLTTTASGSGVWVLSTVASITPFTDGAVFSVVATASDAAGNRSPATAAVIAVDLRAPAAPVLTGPASPNGQARPVLSGTAEPGTSLSLAIDPNGDGDLTDAVTYALPVPASGVWQVDLSTANPAFPGFADGSQAAVAMTATDAAGNATTATAGITTDLSVPAAPVISAPPSRTNDATPVIAGSGPADGTVTVVIDPDAGGPLGPITYDAVVDGSGRWLIDTGTAVPSAGTAIASVPLGDGATVTITATARNRAGTTGPTASASTVVDLSTPVPTITGPGSAVASRTPPLTGTAESGATVLITVDVDGNPAHQVTYGTIAAADGTWQIATATATPLTGALPTGGLEGRFVVTAVATDVAGNVSATASATSVVAGASGGQAAQIAFGPHDFAYDGVPKPVSVTVAPATLHLRVFWRDAASPTAVEVAIDPANPADAARWPSAVGVYAVRAVVLDAGWSGASSTTLTIFGSRDFDLDSRRCGLGSNFALIGFALLAFGLRSRLVRRGAAGRTGAVLLLVAAVAVPRLGAAEVPVDQQVPAAAAPAADSGPLPGGAEPVVPAVPAVATVEAASALTVIAPVIAPPSAVATDLWFLGIGILPHPELHGDGEQISGSRLTQSDWIASPEIRIGVERTLPFWRGQDHGPWARLQLSGTILHGDEQRLNASNGYRYDFAHRLFVMPLTVAAGWEWRPAPPLRLTAGAHAAAGPVFARVVGSTTISGTRYGSSAETYGLSLTYGVDATAWWMWGGDRDGLGFHATYDRSRVSVSYRLEEDVDANGRTDRYDRRIDLDGFGFGLVYGHRW